MKELFRPHDNEWLLNKFDYYKILRERKKAYFSKTYDMHIITRHKDVVDILSDAETFSSANGNLIVEKTARLELTLGSSDDPLHGYYKSIVKNAYSKSNIDRIASTYREQVKNKLSKTSTINISDVADVTTAWAIAETINFPYNKEHIANLIFRIQREASYTVHNAISEEARIEFSRIMIRDILRKTPSPGPGIYHEYINSELITDIGPTSLFTGPTISGASSTTGAIEFMVLDLFRQGQVPKLLKDKKLIPDAIDECLRFNSTTGRFRRTATKPITVHGVKLKPGDKVAVCLESANRDHTVFENPDSFIIDRPNKGNLAFGHGMHACIALAISKTLMTVFLEELLDHVGNYHVVTKDANLQYVITASGNDDMISNLIIKKQSSSLFDKYN